MSNVTVKQPDKSYWIKNTTNNQLDIDFKNSKISLWSNRMISFNSDKNPNNSKIALWCNQMYNMPPEKKADRKKVITRLAAVVIWSAYFYTLQINQKHVLK